jgi:hypothetical protein
MENTNTSDLAKSLEDAYVKADWPNAIKMLLEHKESFQEGNYYYNLGTIYAKQGNLAAARYHLEKSIKTGGEEFKAFSNLQLIKEKLNVPELETSPLLYERAISFSMATPVALYLSLTLLLSMAVLFLIKFKKIKKIRLMILAFAVALVPYCGAKFWLSKKNFAIAFQDTPIRVGPSEIYESLGVLKAGSKVIVDSLNNDHFWIKHPQQLSGWVKKENLGLY